jgi:hypothetical protein
VSQQTPSTHSPLVHWLLVLHALLLGSVELQTPAEQKLPAVQSALVWQFPLQASAPHVNAPQLCVWTGGQLPCPSQLAERVATPLVQLAPRQLVSG